MLDFGAQERRSLEKSGARALCARLVEWIFAAIPIGAALQLQDVPHFLFIMLWINALAWPCFAFLTTMRSARPALIERSALLIDGALGGAWIALVGFNPIVTLMLVATLAAGKMAFGGWIVLVKAALLQFTAAMCVGAFVGYKPQLEVPLDLILLCAPCLIGYPLVVGLIAHGLLETIGRQAKTISKFSKTDPQTGLSHYSHWRSLADQAFQEFREQRICSALLVVDIDHCKTINDTYGHELGDDVIRMVALTIKQFVREHDAAAQYGGGAFVVMISNVTLEQALSVSERIRQAISSASLARAPKLQLSGSIGVAVTDEEVSSLDVWFTKADGALYEAKALGRNQVVSAMTSIQDKIKDAAYSRRE